MTEEEMEEAMNSFGGGLEQPMNWPKSIILDQNFTQEQPMDVVASNAALSMIGITDANFGS